MAYDWWESRCDSYRGWSSCCGFAAAFDETCSGLSSFNWNGSGDADLFASSFWTAAYLLSSAAAIFATASSSCGSCSGGCACTGS
jgi:hypothetical protein